MARVMTSMLAMLALLWIIYTGYMFATATQGYVLGLEFIDIQYAIVFGAFTIAFGLFSFIFGLRLLAELVLASLTSSLEDTKASHIQGLTTEMEQKKCREVFVHISVTTISVFMLIWTSYYGYRLVNEPLKEQKLHRLSFLVGIIAIAFGLTNFLIGIAILADSAKSLPADLREKLVAYNVYEDTKINAELEV